jgi:protein-L-isoaspartate(D-aspartate) O-methyltransferase
MMKRAPAFTLTAYFALVMAVQPPSPAAAQTKEEMERARNRMVEEEIVAAGVTDPRVIHAMRTTPRHEFVLRKDRPKAYYDMAMPIGESQTISPPFVVAYMTEQLDPKPTDKVLEIGTGSGYQAAVLSDLVREVYTIEIVESLARRAAYTLRRLRYKNVHTKAGDGFKGWPEHAPFDKIIVTCSPEKVPPALAAQLAEGGRMVVPVGERYQQTLYLLKKVEGKLEVEALRPTLFVPMTGEAERRRQIQPDPANPGIHNGGFEDSVGDPPTPVGWHYLRQCALVTDGEAPSGKNYLRLSNQDLGRGCRALQGMPVNGREVKQLAVSLHVRAADIRPGPRLRLPMLVITFYDEQRAEAGQGIVGPWRGSFGWQKQSATIDVPPRAREAIVRVAMLGATGEVSVDDIRIQRAD